MSRRPRNNDRALRMARPWLIFLILLLTLFLPGCGLIDDNGKWPDSEHPSERQVR